MQGAKHTGNFVRSIMRPRPGQAVSVQMEDGMPKQVRVSRRNQATADVNISSDILGNISLTIYHLVNGSELPVEFKFVYCPDAPYALIREVMDGRDNRICLPLRMISCIGDQIGELSTPVVGMTDSSASYKKNGFIVTEDFVKRYCRTVDNRCAYYQPHDSRQMHAPMDALFVIATPGLFKFLTISPFNEGVLDMLHLGYQCSFADTFQTLRVGDSISYEVTMQELVNVIGGKRLVLRVQFYSMGTRIASLSTSFHYRNTTVDQSIAFRHVQEAPMELKIQTQADAAVLRNREWFVPSEGAEADIVPGTVLEFELSSHYRFKSETVYSYIQTTGRVMRRNPCVPGQKVVVGEVDFECYESLGNPVIAFLQRHGTGMDPVSLFDGPGIPVQKKMRVVAPRSAAPYAAASGDFNPIHTNPYMASYAGLPSTIIHGMWTAATTRALIEETVAQGIPDRMRAYSTEFVDMVFPGDTLDTKLYHIGMKGGRMLVSGETVNQRGSAVLTCTAEIEQPPTAMVFTGQGAQQVGMGMDLYAASEAARSVWDRADAHMIARYGVSLLHIVRKNPTEVTVKFSRCQKGALVHKSYMSLETELVNGDGSVSTVPLFPDINTRTRSFTHRAASGLLNATQFTQPAQTVFALACIADMRSKSLIPERAVFAGHSLGEFGALAAMTHIFSVEDIVDITFYRGMLLNKSVERDAQNRSQYGMAAVNPARVARAFNESELYFVVEAICRHGKRLLELVNLNVNGQQYVVTGHLSQLDVLRRVLDTISIRRISTSGHSWKEHVEALIRDTIVAHDGDITPRRGRATIPLSGIDVPSHSTQLLPAVACFRRCLQGRIRAGAVDYQQLRDIYIPNVTARAFEVSKDYFEHAHGITRSPVLAWELRDWNYPDVPEHSSVVSHLARTLLIELIAYQFASPVRWIATQDLLFGARGISRLIEVGPTPTLIGMAHKTLAAEKFTERDVTVLHIQQNNSDVYYLYEEEVVDDAEHSVEDTAPVATPV
ncbi:fatty acid synthase alpha subunit Lsd1, partial [Linderina macrospora]